MEKYEIVKWLENFKKRLKDIAEVIKVEQLKKECDGEYTLECHPYLCFLFLMQRYKE